MPVLLHQSVDRAFELGPNRGPAVGNQVKGLLVSTSRRAWGGDGCQFLTILATFQVGLTTP
jgi:hypothetical protein